MHSFVNHYANVTSTFRQQSWKKQKQKAVAVPTPRAANVSNPNTLGRGGGSHHQQQQQQQHQQHHSNTLGATSLRHQHQQVTFAILTCNECAQFYSVFLYSSSNSSNNHNNKNTPSLKETCPRTLGATLASRRATRTSRAQWSV
jgi:hypothetical protein